MTAADRFARSLVAPHPDRATYDLAAFAEMAQADQRAAREVLEARAAAGDVRAIDTLGEFILHALAVAVRNHQSRIAQHTQMV